MKILCDVCDKHEASVFCIADEAALCPACDHRVHHANKLAEKHHRFSLHNPSAKDSPLCDICKEKRAFLFCQEDRAILCRDCDFRIHKSNELTRNHSRFLLTGVKLSATSAVYPEPEELNPVIDAKSSKSNGKDTSDRSGVGSGKKSGVATSSISEYLIETLPGWRVDEFLDSDPSSLSPYPTYKIGEEDLLPFWDSELDCNLNIFPTENMGLGLWVPQVTLPLHQNSDEDNCFAVPQITPPPSESRPSKRARTFC